MAVWLCLFVVIVVNFLQVYKQNNFALLWWDRSSRSSRFTKTIDATLGHELQLRHAQLHITIFHFCTTIKIIIKKNISGHMYIYCIPVHVYIILQYFAPPTKKENPIPNTPMCEKNIHCDSHRLQKIRHWHWRLPHLETKGRRFTLRHTGGKTPAQTDPKEKVQQVIRNSNNL